VINPKGMNVSELTAFKATRKSIGEFPGGTAMPLQELVGVDCDIWIPAARPDVLDAGNAGQIKAKLILQGANIPATAEAEEILHARGVLSVPDFIANAGGVICAAVEYHGGTQSQTFTVIKEMIRENTREVLERARAEKLLPRVAAVDLARGRVREAQLYRRA